MKVIYKLPAIILLAVSGIIIYDIYIKYKAANSDGLFDMIKYSESALGGNPNAVIMGISAYNFLMLTGLLCAVLLAVFRRKTINVKIWMAAAIAVAFFLQAYLGAKVLFGIECVLNENSIAAFSMDGQSLYGTIPSTFLFVLILSVIVKRQYGQLLDYLAPLWLTLLIFVRAGCFTVGCCGADACLLAGAEIILPVQLIEVAFDLILLMIVFKMEKRNAAGDGSLFFVMMTGYGAYRFVLEFIRSTQVIFLGMTYGQLYSLLGIAVAVICMTAIKKKKSR